MTAILFGRIEGLKKVKYDLHTMEIIQNEKARDTEQHGQPELDAEGIRLSEEKRIAFDFPVNAVKVDPLR